MPLQNINIDISGYRPWPPNPKDIPTPLFTKYLPWHHILLPAYGND